MTVDPWTNSSCVTWDDFETGIFRNIWGNGLDLRPINPVVELQSLDVRNVHPENPGVVLPHFRHSAPFSAPPKKTMVHEASLLVKVY